MKTPMRAAVRPSVFVSAPSVPKAAVLAPSVPLASTMPMKGTLPAVFKPQQAATHFRPDSGTSMAARKPMLTAVGRIAQQNIETARAAKEAADRAAWNQAQMDRLDAAAQEQAQSSDGSDHGTPQAQTEEQAQQAQQDDREAQTQEQQSQQAQEPQSEVPQDVPLADWETDIPWQERQGFAGEDDDAMAVFAHVHNGTLCATGICPTAFGYIPVSYSMTVPASIPNGPVSAGAELPAVLNPPIAHAMKVLEMKASKDEQALAAESLVLRSRAGDQNAIGMISMIRDAAQKGSPRAKRSVQLIGEYIAKHPASETNPFGAEPQKDSNVLFSACIALANGAPLSTARLKAMASTFGSEEDEKLFLYAVVNYKKAGLVESLVTRFGEYVRKVVELGKGIGLARGIQMVRLPSTPVSAFSADAGWELGE